MKKKIVLAFLVFGWLCLAAGISWTQDLRSGESAVYLKSGDKVIVKIVDISSARLVLETENSGEFPLHAIWMINFVNDQWNFPDERNKIESGDHYLFLKDGGITSGRIVDFSSDQRVFELDNKEKIGIGRIRRIYFAKNPPDSLMKTLPVEKPVEKKEEPNAKNFLGVFRSVETPEIVLFVNENMTAKMTFAARPNLAASSEAGRWELTGTDKITVRLEAQPSLPRRLVKPQAKVFIFRKEGNDLVGENQDRKIYGDLRLRKL